MKSPTKEQGLVLRSTGAWYDVLTDEGERVKARLRGKFKLSDLKVTNPIAVGDRVVLEPERNELYVITDILPRHNYLIRKSTHKNHFSHLLAANIDQALLVATFAHPKTSLGFIDRFLVSAEAFRIPVILFFNKTDLWTDVEPDEFNYLKKVYTDAECTVMAGSLHTKEGMEGLTALLQRKKTLISGHSGVGKSSLMNWLMPELDLDTSPISDFADKGIHTTTFAEMFSINENTFLIDTPGIKELGIAEIEKSELSHYFPEMRKLLNQCRFANCRHLNEPGCAVVKSVETGELAIERYKSYLSMMEDDDNRR